MNILDFKNATQTFMNSAIMRWHTALNSTRVVSVWAFASALLGVGVAVYCGAHYVPILPFEGEELVRATGSWQNIVVAKFVTISLLSMFPYVALMHVWKGWVRRQLSHRGLPLLLNDISKPASHQVKQNVIETALKLQNPTHCATIEQLKVCVQEELPKAWWEAVHIQIKNDLRDEILSNPNHCHISEEQQRLNTARAQLQRRAHMVTGASDLKV